MTSSKPGTGGSPRPIAPACVTPETQAGLIDLLPFACGIAPAEWHLDAHDDQLVAGLLGHHLRSITCAHPGLTEELEAEFLARISSMAAVVRNAQVASSIAIDHATRKTLLRMDRMWPDRVLYVGQLQLATIDRVTLRARRVEQLLIRFARYEKAERAARAKRVSDEVLIDLMMWTMCMSSSTGATVTDTVSESGIVNQIIARAENEGFLAEAIDEFLTNDSIAGYRRAHNLSADHEFWSDARVRAALAFGMT